MKCTLSVTLLVISTQALATALDPIALNFAREAKNHDRRGKGIETAVWVIEYAEDTYACEFWNENLRVRNDWARFEFSKKSD